MNHQFLSAQGGASNHLESTIPTGTYTFGSSVDMGTYDSAFIYFTVGTNQSSTTTQVKWQWSLDSTNWGDEPVDSAATATATTQPYNPLSRVINIPMDTAGYLYPVRVHRMGLYLRAGIATSNVTTGTLSIKIIKASNYN